MRVTEAKMNFAPQKIYFAALCGAFFLYGLTRLTQLQLTPFCRIVYPCLALSTIISQLVSFSERQIPFMQFKMKVKASRQGSHINCQTLTLLLKPFKGILSLKNVFTSMYYGFIPIKWRHLPLRCHFSRKQLFLSKTF